MKQELQAMITLAERLLASNTPGTLATLFSACGSTYRTLGSMMVSLPGMHAGGVSGGCLEEHVARAGERATRHTPAVMLRFSTHPDADDDVPTLGCGGSIELLVERLTSDHLLLLKELARAYDRDEGSLLACIVERANPSLSVTRQWLHPTEGFGQAEPELAQLCAHVEREARSDQVALDVNRDVLVHYVPPLTRLVIFGAGDDARPLCNIGASLGWHVSVADRRARLATEERFPHADAVLAADWDEAVEALRFSPRTAAVLMTHSLQDDARVLSLLSGRQLSYIGALGPAQRRQWLLEDVAAHSGQLMDAAIALRGPIGLNLGDRSPAGIALAVAAEILAQFNARDARPLHTETRSSPVARRPGVCLVRA
jgi:xanthine/CO dehydrogenase XdhC/CoxF family maturation factor